MALEVRRLEASDVATVGSLVPLWNASEYERRLHAQRRIQLVQAIAWEGEAPVGRGMVLFPEHDEYSASAVRERCAEVRDVSVPERYRRRGVATALMRFLENEARGAAFSRAGLAVSLDEGSAPARALYDRLGYRRAHGPFVASTLLYGDDEPFPVSAVLVYLVKEL